MNLQQVKKDNKYQQNVHIGIAICSNVYSFWILEEFERKESLCLKYIRMI